MCRLNSISLAVVLTLFVAATLGGRVAADRPENSTAPPPTEAPEAATTIAESDLLPADEQQASPATTTAPAATTTTTKKEPLEVGPSRQKLFASERLDVKTLEQLDCHLRNVDLCLAGALASSTKALPETDAELEARCDESKAASACLAVYYERCQPLGVLAPLLKSVTGTAEDTSPLAATALSAADQVHADAARREPQSAENAAPLSADGAAAQQLPRPSDLAALCEPDAKQRDSILRLRAQLFKLANCVNPRLPLIRPCINDLKAALQVFYEQTRSLPVRQSCCALSRFRKCASDALDNVCGLSSLDGLIASISGGGGGQSSGSLSMVRSIKRVCKQSSSDFRSPFCVEVLPPSGMRVPRQRGKKASKLAKALDLISF